MFPQLPTGLQNRVSGELKIGESVVWVGQPNANKRMLAGFGLWLFFIPWTVFAVIWTLLAGGFRWLDASNAEFDFMPFVGIPFILFGLGGFFSPLLMRASAVRTAYVITNQRAFVISGFSTMKYKSYYPEQIKFVERKERRDGSGDLIFASETFLDSSGSNRTKTDGFYAVSNVKTVESHLQNLLHNR